MSVSINYDGRLSVWPIIWLLITQNMWPKWAKIMWSDYEDELSEKFSRTKDSVYKSTLKLHTNWPKIENSILNLIAFNNMDWFCLNWLVCVLL